MSTQYDLLHQCTEALASGNADLFRSLALSRDTVSVRDAAFHLAWADVLEEAAMTDGVVQELNLAVRDAPGNRSLYARLAEICLDLGRADRAAICWKSWLRQNPKDADAYRRLGQLLRECGEQERALQVFQKGYRETQDSSFNALIRELQSGREAESVPEGKQSGDQIVPVQHHLVTFTTLFSGREGVYARQWISPTGEGGYTPVHEPLTLKVAENHILGNHTVGVYPVRMDNTVNFIALDLDIAKFAVNKAITNQKAWNQIMDRLHGVACKIVDCGAAHDLPVWLEDSGFKGRHAWIFLETPVPAGVAKKCGDLLRAQLGTIPPEVMIEVFPKQSKVNPGSLGNLIKLPLGYHKRTGRRSLFLDPDGTPCADQLRRMETFEKASRRAVYALIQRITAPKGASPPQPAPSSAPPAEEPPWETSPDESGLSPLPSESYDVERDAQVQYLLSRCPVLRSIVERVNRSAGLTKDETLVLIHVLGHLDQGPKAVNQILQRCAHVEPSLLLKSPLRGNPMSCPKIRSRVPQITSAVACNCRFDPSVNLYPTPLIHIHSMKNAPVSHPLGVTLDSMQFQQLLQEYLKLKQQAQEVSLLLRKVESQLTAFFDEAGVSTVQTPMGELTRVQAEGGKTVFTLTV